MWSHPPRGSCIPECSLYGQCHCRCGQDAPVAVQGRTDRGGTIRGQPQVFRHGHYARWAKIIPPGGSRLPHCGEDIDVAALRELVERWGTMFIVAHYLGVSHAWVSMALREDIKRCRRFIADRIREGSEVQRLPELPAWIPVARVLPMVEFLLRHCETMRAVDRVLGMSEDWTCGFMHGRQHRGVRRSTALKITEAVRVYYIPPASRSQWDVPRRLIPAEERDLERKRQGREERSYYRRKGAAA